MKPMLLILILLMIFACNGDGPAPSATLSDADIAANNQGVGLMGQFKYTEAETVFRELATKYPKNHTLAVNLAIATLNRQNPGDEQAALNILAEVLKDDPNHQAAQYCSGLLHLYLGNEPEALKHFSAVQDDSYASYQVAQILSNRGEIEQALGKFDAVLKKDPYLRSAYYAAFRTNQQAGNSDRARTLLSEFQKLKDNPRAHLFEIKYTRMGPLAEVTTLGEAATITAPSGALFGELKPLGGEQAWTRPEREPSLTAIDLNQDGQVDLFQTAGTAQGTNLVWINQGNGNFEQLPNHPLSAVPGVQATLWGDFDNDGLADVYFCRKGPNQLWRQFEDGTWQDITTDSQTAGGELDTVAGAFFDADHDGDLDLFLVNADGPNELLNNNRNGSTQPIAEAQNLHGDNRASKGLVVGDFDGDRDADILIIHAEPPHQVFLNDRLWSYRQTDAFKALENQAIAAAFVTDLAGDGHFELITVNPAGLIQSWTMDSQTVTAKPLGNLSKPGSGFTLADLNGDGPGELIYRHDQGWSYASIGSSASDLKESQGPGGKMATLLPVVLNPSLGYALATIAENGQPTIIPAGPGRHPFLSVSLSGKEDTGQAMRSNASGIGTEVAARSGAHWTISHHYPVPASPGQSLQPLALGLGGAKTADFLALEWSDGVYQTEMALSTNTLHSISETQRQLSSCPVIFTWDGEKDVFVSDVLGVAGIGFAIGKGIYSQPRPWEHFLMPRDIAQPKDGKYILKITEPMEEAAFIDSAKLVHYDLPEGWDLVIDERMWISGPKPTGHAIFFQSERLPVQVTNERGDDISQAVKHVDLQAAPIPKKDHRFLGRLASNHQVTLRFDAPLNSPGQTPVLMADGWVEYPYSQTMFAAWQADAAYEAPTLEAKGKDGQWQVLYKQFGYPAGMPRRMALPLPQLPPDTTALRLTSNLEIYWDRFAIAMAEPCPQAKKTELSPIYADVRQSGFAKRTNGKDMLPQYDYSQRVPLWDTRYMTGAYTQTGPMLPLLENVDDALAIIGPGEEIHMEFPADSVSQESNHRLVLEIQGWCKDMDLFTKDGDTLGPLPKAGHPPAARTLLHARYNTRYQSGR